MKGYVVKGKAIRKEYEGKRYEIEEYTGEHANEYCVYEIKNGVRDGTAELFEDGMVKMQWTMIKGKRKGSYIVFDKGVVVREGRWADTNSGEERVVDNKMTGLMMVIRNNGEKVYEGECNEQLQREGYGMEYENGVLKRCGEWKGDAIVELTARFVNENEMIEYGKGTTMKLISHIPIYVGGFIVSQKTGRVKRNGHGRVLNEWTGVCEYESEWKNGKEDEEQRIYLHDGWYGDRSSKEFTRVVVTGKEPQKKQSSKQTKSDSTISQNCVLPSSLATDIETIEELVIGPKSYNDEYLDQFELTDLPNLKIITIGQDSFEKTRTFYIHEMNGLKKIMVGRRCFTYDDVYRIKERKNGLFRIENCAQLQSIQVADYAFSNYSFMILNELDELGKLCIGNKCFFFAPLLTLSGKQELKNTK